MKKAFTKWYNYVIAVGLNCIVACIAVIPYFVLSDSKKWPGTYMSYVFLFAGVVLFGVGFIIQDIYRARTRHKTKNWNNPLDEANLNTAWAIFCPMFVAGILAVIIGAILYPFVINM